MKCRSEYSNSIGSRSKEKVQRSVGVDIDSRTSKGIKVSECRVSCRIVSVVKSLKIDRPAVHTFS